MSGRDALGEFLGLQSATPAPDIDTRCGMMLADWWRFKTGRDIPPYNPRHSLARLVCGACRKLGLPTTPEPARGDVGLVRAGNTTFGAVFTGTSWAAKSPLGVVILKRVEILRAWRV